MIILIVIGTIITVAALIVVIGYLLSAPGYLGKKSEHFDGKKFFTPNGKPGKGGKDLFDWMITRKKGKWTSNYETFQGSKPQSMVHDDLVVTFINHSTFLIQTDSLNILTDPVWSKRVSPFSFLGPKRMRPAGIRLADLPNIDLVLLSHNHYDHLDIQTLKKLNDQFKPLIITSLGVGKYLKKQGITTYKELDWWEKASVGVEVTAVPAQHFSGRGMFDRDKTLWCGFTMKTSTRKLYFAGDSGWGKFFKEIGAKEGPFDLSFIPIGAFQPLWFMNPIHISPFEAVDVHRAVKSKLSLAMHFGTFPLADDAQGEAESEFHRAVKKRQLPPNEFLIPEEGVPLKF
ncbi:MAG: MBL fold metallo-hydrolase [Cyclobacteriaceae bacterium]